MSKKYKYVERHNQEPSDYGSKEYSISADSLHTVEDIIEYLKLAQLSNITFSSESCITEKNKHLIIVEEYNRHEG